MDFLAVLLRLLAVAEKKRDGEEATLLLIAVLVPAACHCCYSWGLFCVGVERGEILPWHFQMRNDTVSPNVAPHRPVMD